MLFSNDKNLLSKYQCFVNIHNYYMEDVCNTFYGGLEWKMHVDSVHIIGWSNLSYL